jgi:hypothetical protein
MAQSSVPDQAVRPRARRRQAERYERMFWGSFTAVGAQREP